ncbi:MAG: NADH-quinone oxidoreductase subunit A [Candidatus Tectomicrobia bacterium]|nr:NADH-quinone oxidoreductase subunit A [Candidatus Tectomicrobia bacterium]
MTSLERLFFGDYQSISPYLPILLFIIIAAGFAIVTLFIGFFVRPRRPDPEKLSPYECGIDPVMGTRERFSIRFYVIAMIFLIFDVEVVFLFPWAVVYKKIGIFGFVEMMLFIFILLVGYYYAWKKGALEWV